MNCSQIYFETPGIYFESRFNQQDMINEDNNNK